MSFLKIKLLVISVIMFAASSAFASMSYDINVDTSSVLGESGYLYLTFNTGVTQIGTYTASLTNFTSDGSLGATVASTTPGVTGTLVTGAFGTAPGNVSMTSGTVQTVDYNQAITFGHYFDFKLVLPDAGPQNATSNFGLSLAADAFGAQLVSKADGVTPVLTGDANGQLINITLNGDLTASAVSSDASAQATPTPLPAAAWLFGSGIMGLAGIRRRKNA